jgi:hypothetical protein
MIYDWDISSFFCNEGPSSKTNKSLLYRCEEEGCCKSYSNRQNLRRHKLKEHVESMMAKLAAKSDECLRRQQADAAQREQELLIETFSSFYEQFGEEQASIAIKNNGKLKDHLIPLRKIMEDNLAAHSANAQESQSVVEKHLAQFRAISTESVDELNAFDAVINLVKEATPEKVARLKQFCQVITAFTNHVADHSESANPKIKHARAFKISTRTRKNYQGLALCVLYKDGWNEAADCPRWSVRSFMEPMFVTSTKDKQEKLGLLVVGAVPALEKFRPRLFGSIMDICAALSSHSLPKLKKKFQKGDGLPIGQFTEVCPVGCVLRQCCRCVLCG